MTKLATACGSIAAAAILGFPWAPPRTDAETIIATERLALDRWGQGAPEGYLAVYAPDISYFDPMTARRVDGLPAMRKLYEPIAGKVRVRRYEMIGQRVQQQGSMAVLSYNLVSHVNRANGDSTIVRWNSTAVYQKTRGTWKTVHTHWSYTQPQLERPVSEVSAAGPSAVDLVGTWQIVSVKNLETGTVDSVAAHSLAWLIFGPSHMAFTFMKRDRAGMNPADVALLSPAEKAMTYHRWAWTPENVQTFGGLASTWHLSGDTLKYGSEMRLNPFRVGKPFTETIVSLDSTTLVVRTNVTGTWKEETSRRIR